MASSRPESARDGEEAAAQLNELLTFQPEKQNETVHEMFLRLLQLVDLMYTATPQPGEDEANTETIPYRAANTIVPIVHKLIACFDEQETRCQEEVGKMQENIDKLQEDIGKLEADTCKPQEDACQHQQDVNKLHEEIAKLRETLIDRDIELKRILTAWEEERDSPAYRPSQDNDTDDSMSPISLSPKISSIEDCTQIVASVLQMEGMKEDTDDKVIDAAPAVNKYVRKRWQPRHREMEIEDDSQPALASSETDLPQPTTPTYYQYQKISPVESPPQQAFDSTFPSSRRRIPRPGPAYENIPALRSDPMTPQGVLSGGDPKPTERHSVSCSCGSTNLVAKDGRSQGENTEKSLQQTLGQESDSSPAITGVKNHLTYSPEISVEWPESTESASKPFQRHKHAIFILFDELQQSVYTTCGVGRDLVLGQLIAWWHLVLFLTTALYRATMILQLFTSGTSWLDSCHLPKVPVCRVPVLSLCIIATQSMFIASLVSFFAWKRELDVLLLANGLTRKYMLDYIYEESRMILFIGIDKGVFRLGVSEEGEAWQSLNG